MVSMCQKLTRRGECKYIYTLAALALRLDMVRTPGRRPEANIALFATQLDRPPAVAR